MCLLDICPPMSHWLSQSFSPLCTAVFFFTACKTRTHSVNVRKHMKKLYVSLHFKGKATLHSHFLWCMETFNIILIVYFHLHIYSNTCNQILGIFMLLPVFNSLAKKLHVFIHTQDKHMREQQAPAGRIWICSEA